MDQKTIREYIRCLEHLTAFMRTLLDEDKRMPAPPLEDRERVAEITDLRLLSKSDAWPQAVPEDLICAEEEEHKLNRAAGIIHEFINTDLEGKKFLDFGCGEGHVPYLAASLVGATAIGYDPVAQNWKHFDPQPGVLFMTSWPNVKEQGPFDVILVNDVLDHTTDMKTALNQVREVKAPQTGKIYIRCHPWTSRHGTHLYKQLNRAYLHLVFTAEELRTMGLKEMPTQQLLDPLEAYRSAIKDAGLSIVKEEVISHPVEFFFTRRAHILRRIKERFAKSNNPKYASGEEFPRDILEIQFVDYILV